MGSFGPLEIILIFLVVLLIFGAKRIPEIARGIGKGIREFKDATSEISREIESEAQNRQINQPRSPQQGQPQARQSQQQPSQQETTSQEESSAESASDGDADPASEANASENTQKASS
jgi:sec-independent protein translocase protein TatA